MGEGLGLGLAIVQSICRDLGGEIIAENTAGGAEFRVTLPLAEAFNCGDNYDAG
ncbi:ATP-binding protein [Aliamphritea spongicola]